MKTRFVFAILAGTLGLLQSCGEQVFENKESYTLNVGDELELYYTTNSCCYYCFNGEELECLELKDKRVVQDYEDGCDGCAQTESFVFDATKAGTDTVYLSKIEGGEDCLIDKSSAQKIIVTVQ